MRKKIRIFQPKLSWLAIPFALIFVAYFVVPLILTLIVSFWDYTEYSIIPDFIFGNYQEKRSVVWSPFPAICY